MKLELTRKTQYTGNPAVLKRKNHRNDMPGQFVAREICHVVASNQYMRTEPLKGRNWSLARKSNRHVWGKG